MEVQLLHRYIQQTVQISCLERLTEVPPSALLAVTWSFPFLHSNHHYQIWFGGCEGKQIMMRYKEEKEAKKEAFRKYLESSGAVDALTKVLVALYEQHDKPSSALEFIQQKLGSTSISDHEKLQAELSDLQMKYNELLAAHQQTCKELEEIKSSQAMAVTSTRETTDSESPKTLL